MAIAELESKVEKALATCRRRLEQGSGDIGAQIKIMYDGLDRLLKTIRSGNPIPAWAQNVGLFAVREFEDADPELAEQLHEVSGAIRRNIKS